MKVKKLLTWSLAVLSCETIGTEAQVAGGLLNARASVQAEAGIAGDDEVVTDGARIPKITVAGEVPGGQVREQRCHRNNAGRSITRALPPEGETEEEVRRQESMKRESESEEKDELKDEGLGAYVLEVVNLHRVNLRGFELGKARVGSSLGLKKRRGRR